MSLAKHVPHDARIVRNIGSIFPYFLEGPELKVKSPDLGPVTYIHFTLHINVLNLILIYIT